MYQLSFLFQMVVFYGLFVVHDQYLYRQCSHHHHQHRHRHQYLKNLNFIKFEFQYIQKVSISKRRKKRLTWYINQ